MASRRKSKGSGWGGARPGAGRKPGPNPKPRHVKREGFRPQTPIHVQLKPVEGLPTLRTRRVFSELEEALEASDDRFGFYIDRYAATKDTLHLLVRAGRRNSLFRGMQGLSIRIARGLNRAWDRDGQVFDTRYRADVLDTPEKVRAAMKQFPSGSPWSGVLE